MDYIRQGTHTQSGPGLLQSPTGWEWTSDLNSLTGGNVKEIIAEDSVRAFELQFDITGKGIRRERDYQVLAFLRHIPAEFEVRESDVLFFGKQRCLLR